jgi:hypothetical protein
MPSADSPVAPAWWCRHLSERHVHDRRGGQQLVGPAGELLVGEAGDRRLSSLNTSSGLDEDAQLGR